jgi:hypothetical protein
MVGAIMLRDIIDGPVDDIALLEDDMAPGLE